MAEGNCDCGRSFPRGYRFRPTDEDYLFYLKLKIDKKPIPIREFSDVNLYEYHPQTISERYPQLGDNGWHVFSSRNRKYKNGLRPNRAAGAGYWKATGKDIAIKGTNGKKQVILGYKQALVFCQGKAPKGIPTHWGMHEYRIDKPEPSRRGSNDMKLDDWILCRVYIKQRQRDGRNNIGRTVPDRSQPDSVENIELINVGDGPEVEYQNSEEGDPTLLDNSTFGEVLGFEDHNLLMEHNNPIYNDLAMVDYDTIMSRYNQDLQTHIQNVVAAPTYVNQVSQLPVDLLTQFQNINAAPSYVDEVSQRPVIPTQFQTVDDATNYVNQVPELPVIPTFLNAVATSNHLDQEYQLSDYVQYYSIFRNNNINFGSEGSIPSRTVNHVRDREDNFSASSGEQLQQVCISSGSVPTMTDDHLAPSNNDTT